MTQIFFPPKSEVEEQKLYCYVNTQNSMAIAKVKDLNNWHCERVVFPGEKFLFRANNDCNLEISQHTNGGITKDFIPCSQLKVIDSQKQPR